MEYSLILDNDALTDVDEAAAWYESQRDGLRVDFLLKFDEAIEFLQSHPKIFSLVLVHFRRMLMNRFPYAIYYSVDDELKEIDVVGVFHTSMNPEVWKERLALEE